MTYVPKPIDLKSVKIPEELEPLVELLAENAHENWAAQRISEGWTYGEKRDDDLKLHPDLVLYNELSDGEKEYDRITALGMIKMVYALGFKIEKS